MPFSFDAFEAPNVNVDDEFPVVDGVDPKVNAGVDGFSVVLFSIFDDEPLFCDKLLPNEKEV